jgi:uncharacterized protein (TIGR02246 family)
MGIGRDYCTKEGLRPFPFGARAMSIKRATFLFCAAGVGLTACGFAVSDALRPSPRALALVGPAAKPRPGGTLDDEEAAIRKAMAAFSDAYTKNDLTAILAIWTDEPELVRDNGQVIRGKKALSAVLKKSMESHKGYTHSAKTNAIRFVKGDVATEDGVATLTAPDGSIESTAYASIWVKAAGKWRLSGVRDLPDRDEEERPAAFGKLKQLAWLVGDWRDAGGKDGVTLKGRWAPNQTFIVLTFSAKQADGSVFGATQFVGWDAAEGALRSWQFDTAGGFSETAWAREGNAWVGETSMTYPDGRTGTSTSRWKYVDAGNAVWSSEDRQADEQPLPDITIQLRKLAKGA